MSRAERALVPMQLSIIGPEHIVESLLLPAEYFHFHANNPAEQVSHKKPEKITARQATPNATRSEVCSRVGLTVQIWTISDWLSMAIKNHVVSKGTADR